MVDERTERLITRRLDGELTESESLELDKLLIRDPRSRTQFEHQQRLDGLARDALHDVFAREPRRDDLDRQVSQPARFAPRSDWTRRMTQRGLSIATAAAVFILAIYATQLFWPTLNRAPLAAVNPENPPAPDAQMLVRNDSPDAAPRGTGEPGSRPIPAMPASYQPMRDMIGVFDEETESLYLLEMPRPVARSRVRVNY